MKILKLLLFYLLLCQSTQSQVSSTNSPLEIGKPFPTHVFKDVHFYDKAEVAIHDFRGKWLVLDFFSIGCTSCFQSLPKMNQLAKDFDKEAEIVMVGSYHKNIKEAYEKFRKRYKLTLPVFYEKELIKKLQIIGYPYIVILDKNSTVRGITASINKRKLSDLINGKIDFINDSQGSQSARNLSDTLYDHTKPLLIDNNGGKDTDYLYRSVLTKYTGDFVSLQEHYVNSFRHINGESNKYLQGRVQAIGKPLPQLYYMAYGDTIPYRWGTINSYGKYWYEPLLETKDSLNPNWSPKNEELRYNYSLTVPKEKGSAQYLQEAMRRDLQTYFGYAVSVETRMMPYWKLVATKKAKRKLKTKYQGDKMTQGKEFLPNTGCAFRNGTISQVINLISSYYQRGAPFIDETGIDFRIDFELEAILTDFEDVKRGLQKSGLDLVKGEKEMKVVVIRDPK
ncbi:TlpA disulfide reductase family protein [uncultured Polaribacter sp.]|uniref:TlpA family protein disulfide reductase n=1 Tax=uncultured Polaribacter sp. TaxID=174711 RepID=UPI00260D090E|nr:TlpA disulfide reductase family protein [uncultured Polaribacter sp.]